MSDPPPPLAAPPTPPSAGSPSAIPPPLTNLPQKASITKIAPPAAAIPPPLTSPKATSIPPPITTSGSTSPAKAKNVLRSSTKGHRLSTASAKLPTAPSPKKIPPSTAGATENGSSGGTTEGKRRSDSNSSSSSMQSSNEEKKRKKKSGESPRGEKNSPKRTAAMSNESQSLSSQLDSEVKGVTMEPPKKDTPKKDKISKKSRRKFDTLKGKKKSDMTDADVRLLVIEEIITSEKDYVDDLNNIIRGFLQPLRASANARSEVPVLFSNIELIYSVNSTLLSRLDERVGQGQDLAISVGDIFCDMSEQLLCYDQYCTNHAKASEGLAKALRNPGFAAEVDKCRNRFAAQGKLLQLHDLLIKPIQRICKYPLLFEELLRLTPDTHPDRGPLQQALLKLNFVADQINESKAAAENLQKLKEIQRVVDGLHEMKIKLAVPGRFYCYEGVLDKINPRGKVQSRYFFLLSDMLVWCKAKAMKKNHFEYKGHLLLDCCVLREANDLKKHRHCFQIIRLDNKKIYTLMAQSREGKKLWMSEIDRLVNQYLESEQQEHRAALSATVEEPLESPAARRRSGTHLQGQPTRPASTRSQTPQRMPAGTISVNPLNPRAEQQLDKLARINNMMATNANEEEIDGASSEEATTPTRPAQFSKAPQLVSPSTSAKAPAVASSSAAAASTSSAALASPPESRASRQTFYGGMRDLDEMDEIDEGIDAMCMIEALANRLSEIETKFEESQNSRALLVSRVEDLERMNDKLRRKMKRLVRERSLLGNDELSCESSEV